MTQPLYFLSQQQAPSVPSSTSFDDAVLWNYSVTLVASGSDIRFEVTWNRDRTESYVATFEDVDGVAQIRVTASAGDPPLPLLAETTLVATDGGYRYRNSDGSWLPYAEAVDTRTRTFVFERLNVLHVQSALSRAGEVAFGEPLLPFVEQREPIDAGAGAGGSIAEQLASIFRTLLAESPFASQPVALECRYGYVIGGVPVEAPVVLVQRQEVAIGFDEQLIDMIAGSIHQWLDAVQPPATEARLIFAITFWSALPRVDAPLLRLAHVSMPMSGVAR